MRKWLNNSNIAFLIILLATLVGWGDLLTSALSHPQREGAQYECPDYSAQQTANDRSHPKSFWEAWPCIRQRTWEPVAFFTLVLSGFTGVLAVSTIGLWIVTFLAGIKADKALRAIERAYVKLTHFGKLEIVEHGGICEVGFQIEVRNNGNTPACVTDIRMSSLTTKKDEALPTSPPYPKVSADGRPPSKAFMVATETFYKSFTTEVPKHSIDPIKAGKERLFLFGYVDYIDTFGDRYRGGYAREYDPTRDRLDNNLIFVDNPGYSYDRQRNPTEGIDWDDPHHQGKT